MFEIDRDRPESYYHHPQTKGDASAAGPDTKTLAAGARPSWHTGVAGF